jgi:hypothetical protein
MSINAIYAGQVAAAFEIASSVGAEQASAGPEPLATYCLVRLMTWIPWRRRTTASGSTTERALRTRYR